MSNTLIAWMWLTFMAAQFGDRPLEWHDKVAVFVVMVLAPAIDLERIRRALQKP